ncbi:MAG: hypothetical protein KBD54_02150, partial [Candidatus Pacebacteria bacterium]|nr:hypothetical protein [Candidatus Paceibacterota bacterium]
NKFFKKIRLFLFLLAITLGVGGSVLVVMAGTNLHSFSAVTDGGQPYGALTYVTSSTTFYGMTSVGGTNEFGTLFSLADGVYTSLHHFGAKSDGATPRGSLLFVEGHNKLYGMTSAGGANSCGVIFSYDLNPENLTPYSVLHSFDGGLEAEALGIGGCTPYGSLVYDAGGDLFYGMTNLGGETNQGTLFSLSGDGGTYTRLLSFGGDNAGVYPVDSLIYTGGKLVGMTSAGGTYGNGVLFTLDGSSYTVAHHFGVDAGDGTKPGGSLVLDSGSVVYGMTEETDTIFSYNLDTDAYELLHQFEGEQPYGSLVFDGRSRLYGRAGDALDGPGLLFYYDITTNSYEVLETFNDVTTSGTPPFGSLVYVEAGNALYGMARKGGINDAGAIYQTAASSYPNQFSFENQTGVSTNSSIPSAAVVIEGVYDTAPIQITACSSSCDYSVNDGGATGTVASNDSVVLTVKSGACDTTNSGTLDIGGVTASFSVTTSGCGGGGGGGDSTAPTLSQVTAVPTPTNDQTPSYTFNTTEAGTITVGGSCSSGTTSATSGNNTITFSTLADGTYSNCTIRVTDSSDNISSVLAVNTFVVDTTAPTVSFSIPTTGSSLTVPLTFSATDTNGVTGYRITTSNTPPSSGWSDSAPTEYTFSSYGTKTLYAWATDAVGNVSTENSDSIVLTETPPPDEEEEEEDPGEDNDNNSGGGGGRSSTKTTLEQTIPEEPSAEVVPVEQPEDVAKADTSKENTIQNIVPAITILDSPIKQRIQRSFTPQQVETIEVSIKAIVAGITTVGGAIALASVLFLNPLARPEFILIPIRLWALLLMALGLRKKPAPWGTVYDSITKQPVDPVRVSLIDLDGNEVASSITDGSGRFGFAVEKGIYKVVLTKTNYLFPSHVIAQNNMRDEFYEKPYFGDYIPYDPAAPIQKNIPIDPVDFDTAAWAKKNGDLSINYSKRELVAGQVFNTIFSTTFLIVAASLIVYPEKYNVIIFVLYIVAYIMRRQNDRTKHMGRIYDLYGKPLGQVIMKAYSAVDNTLIKTTKTNRSGRYYLRLPEGLYYIRVERQTTDGLYVPVYASPELMVRNGTLNKVFNIAYSQ